MSYLVHDEDRKGDKMKSRLKLAKEMFNAKLQEAKSEEARSEATKAHEKPVSKKAKVHVQKPPHYMGIIGIGLALLVFYLGFDEMKIIWECSDWPSVSGTIISSDIRKTTEWKRIRFSSDNGGCSGSARGLPFRNRSRRPDPGENAPSCAFRGEEKRTP